MSDIQELKKIIDKYDLRPTKSLGQNFLADKGTLSRISELLDAGENDLVIEVGPGTGALTSYFAGKCRKTVLIEIDRHLIPVLLNRFGEIPGTQIIHADATETDLSSICADFSEHGPANGKLKLISNVPYYVTTQLIQKFVTAVPPFDTIIVTVQTEAAKRIMSGPNEEGYGILPVLANFLFDVKVTERIPSHCFYPQPGVESAVMALTRKRETDISLSEIKGFTGFLRTVFGQRRKKMSNLLKGFSGAADTLPEIIKVIESEGYKDTVRAQEIKPADLWRIYSRIRCFIEK